MFDIDGIVSQIGATQLGKTLVIIDRSSVKRNDRGDIIDTTDTEYNINGIVQVVTALDDEVKEGILSPFDLICFFDNKQTNLSYLKKGNFLKYEGNQYRIDNIIPEIGHTEVHAKKL